jgi:hypothetical protein
MRRKDEPPDQFTTTPAVILKYFVVGSETMKRGRPKKTWRRSIMEEARKEGNTWREVKRLAADRSRWKSSVEALCSSTGDNRK